MCTSLLLIITLSFTCGERKICLTIKQVSKYYKHDCLQNFLLLFMSLLTALIVKNSHIFQGIYFIFLKKHTRSNLKCFQYQM